MVPQCSASLPCIYLLASLCATCACSHLTLSSRSEVIRVYGFSKSPGDIPAVLEGATNLDSSGQEFPFPEEEELKGKRVVACTLATAAKVRKGQEGGREEKRVEERKGGRNMPSQPNLLASPPPLLSALQCRPEGLPLHSHPDRRSRPCRGAPQPVRAGRAGGAQDQGHHVLWVRGAAVKGID